MLLKTKALTKNFGGLTALNLVDFHVEQGEIVAVIGPNGAGKSTFFNVISGFYQPSNGTITFKGQDIRKVPTHSYARLGIARTFQTTNLFTDGTVMDNFIIGYRVKTKMGPFDAIFGTPLAHREEREARVKAEEVMEFVGLSGVAHDPVTSISQEAGKRLAIGLGLITEPQLLLLDEPAAGINHDETNGLAKLIKKIQAAGVTVCLIEHKMKMIMDLADRIMVLNYGSKIGEGTPEQISSNERVIEAYLGGVDHS